LATARTDELQRASDALAAAKADERAAIAAHIAGTSVSTLRLSVSSLFFAALASISVCNATAWAPRLPLVCAFSHWEEASWSL